MEETIKAEMGYSLLKKVGGGGGCINSGSSYETDQGKIYVKFNNDSNSMAMFEGEMASMDSILNTKTVRIPKPYKVFKLPGNGAALAMEYIDMSRGLSTFASQLGQQMAALHKHNEGLFKKEEKESNRLHGGSSDVSHHHPHFGFHVGTCCGKIVQSNDWCDTWPEFYAAKIEYQISYLEQNSGNHEVRGLWDQILKKFSLLFDDLPVIHPSLLHGDLWGGNAAENHDGPMIFDPASFYGHSEYELAIAKMFGGFPRSFFESYHKLIPEAPKFKLRANLYQLFHYMNHWNHFGGGYQQSSLSILKGLVKDLNV